MKRYEEYRDINLPWLKSIPANWKMNRNKVFLQESKNLVGENSNNYTLLSLTLNGIIPRDVSSGKGKFPSDFGTYKVIRPNDIVFCLFDIDETPRTVGLSNLNGMLTGAYDVFHISGINSRYMLYYYLCLDNVKALRPLYKGLRKTINIDTFLGTKMPVPTPAEQEQIVRYLDWQVSKINRLIAAKKRQINTLTEYRKAKIDEIILHGDAHSSQKDSGIWWLRDIPQSWQVLPLKRICQVNASVTNVAKQLSDDEMVTFLPMESVSTKGIVNYSEKRRLADVRSGYSSFAKNDVVIAKITPCFENGKGACLDAMDTDIGYGTTEFINLRAADRILPHYLYMITMTQPFRKLGEEVMTGSAGQKRVPIEFIKGFSVGIPPIKEQTRLLSLLNDITMRIDSQMESYNKSIISLQELRTRLISDVITGQINVRDVEIPDFEYTPETDEVGGDADDEDADGEDIGEQEE